MESLRNTYIHLHEAIHLFLSRHLRFRQQAVHDDIAGDFWRCLGVQPDWVDLFVAANPEYSNGLLYVNPGLESDENCLEKVALLMDYALRWKKFSTTRWLGFGISCQYLALSLAVGLDEVVKIVRNDSRVSDYYLHGYTRLDLTVRRYTVVSAVAVRVADAMAQPLLEDDRLLRHLDDIEDAMQNELGLIRNMGWYSLSRLSAIVGSECNPQEVRQWTVDAALKTASFIVRKCVLPYKAPPFSHTFGATSALHVFNQITAAVKQCEFRLCSCQSSQEQSPLIVNRVAQWCCQCL